MCVCVCVYVRACVRERRERERDNYCVFVFVSIECTSHGVLVLADIPPTSHVPRPSYEKSRKGLVKRVTAACPEGMQ